MTTVAVPVDPPVEGHSLRSFVPDPLTAEEAVNLYRSMVTDVCATVQRGGADLLVNYRPSEHLPVDVDSESVVRDLLASELPDPDGARYEPQVGETDAGRIGNTVTHLLETEALPTVAVIEPTAPFFQREHVGSLLMKLRSANLVVGPAPDGRVYGAGFTAPIDFTDAFAAPAVQTLVERGVDAELSVDFLPLLPVLERPSDLETVWPLLNARRVADRLVPARTTARLESFDLDVALSSSNSQ